MKPRRTRTRVAAIALGVFLAATYAIAAPPENAAIEFKHAYNSALSAARDNETLDPAYELLGVAGNAREQNMSDLAAGAADAFAALVQRAVAAAYRSGETATQDTLEQLVDLRFLAETTHIEKTVASIDSAMRGLFPVVTKAVERRADTAATWDEKLTALGDLANLQASATQVMLPELAAPAAAAFDTRVAAIEAAGTDENADRARQLSDLVALKQARVEQVADATANSVSAVARQMESYGETAGSAHVPRSESGADMSPGQAESDGICVETGYPADRDTASLRRAHDRACINSGRIPVSDRCPRENLSMVCYGTTRDGENITYVYRGTPAEEHFRTACPEKDRVAGNKVPDESLSFRAPNTKLAFVCGASGGDAGD